MVQWIARLSNPCSSLVSASFADARSGPRESCGRGGGSSQEGGGEQDHHVTGQRHARSSSSQEEEEAACVTRGKAQRHGPAAHTHMLCVPPHRVQQSKISHAFMIEPPWPRHAQGSSVDTATSSDADTSDSSRPPSAAASMLSESDFTSGEPPSLAAPLAVHSYQVLVHVPCASVVLTVRTLGASCDA